MHAGTIKKILFDANIMMLSDEFMEGIGSMETCYHDICIEDYGMSVDEKDNSVLKMTISGIVSEKTWDI